jgi:uncharacterized protein (TIGR01777 family)
VRVVVAGSSGLIGTALVRAFRADGAEVVRLVRRVPASPDEARWDPTRPEPGLLGDVDVVVNLGGAGLGDHRWTRAYREEIASSRTQTTKTLAAMAARADQPPRVLISMSGIRYYGVERGQELLTEASDPGFDGFLPRVTHAWEEATAEAQQAGVRVCHLRTGLILASAGGLLPRLTPWFQSGLGAVLGPRNAFWSYLTLHDATDAIRFLAQNTEIDGPVNLTAPNPVRAGDFARALAEAHGHRARLRAPLWALRIAQGHMAPEVLGSLRVIPTRLTDAGFRFRHPTITAALAAEVRSCG